VKKRERQGGKTRCSYKKESELNVGALGAPLPAEEKTRRRRAGKNQELSGMKELVQD